jgi:micrococcal nuclease
VVDGDSVHVLFRDRDVTIRLIGVDTPETVAPGEPVGCYGPEASQFTTTRLTGNHVRLEFDVDRIDPYGRTLAYVWMPDGLLFNETLVRRGFATVATYPPDTRYVDRFEVAQRRAAAADRGLWGVC